MVMFSSFLEFKLLKEDLEKTLDISISEKTTEKKDVIRHNGL